MVDEFGIWPFDRESATAFFTLVSARYERGSIILTSNKGFGEWGELLQRDRVGRTGPAAAPQPRAEHPGGELPAQRETPGNYSRRQHLNAPPEEAGGNYAD